MSIFDNIAYGPRIHGVRDKKRLDFIVRNYLAEAGLWEEVKDRLHHPASRLSVGQQQRLCLARGLAVGPEIILGDEPTSALDPQSSQHVERKLIELKKDNWELAVFPVEDHGFKEPTSWMNEYKRILKLFETQLVNH